MTFKQKLIKLKNRFLKPEWREDLYGWTSWFPLRSREQPALEYDYGNLYTIREDWWQNRPAGLSCMMRVKNEAEFVEASLRSVKDFFDEFVIVYNHCTDGTEAAVRRAVERYGIQNVREYQYPFPLFPCWKDHGKDNPCTSIHSPAFFTNWCQSLTRYSHVCRWDGDNVAISGLCSHESRNRVLASNIFLARGKNISWDFPLVDENIPLLSLEARYYRVSYHTRYIQIPHCEVFTHGWKDSITKVQEPAYLHFKMAKREYRDSGKPGPEWTGEFPDWLYAYRDELIAREAEANAVARRRPLEHEVEPSGS